MKLASLFLLLASLSADAAYVLTNVFTGGTNNDGTGDPLRLAFNKINTNFWAMTNSVGAASNVTWLAANTGSNVSWTAANTASNNLQSQITAESTSLATNTAAFGIRINPLVAGARWTNDAQRATAEIEAKFTDAVGGVPQCAVTVEHGTQTTNNWQISPVGGGLGATLTTPLTNRYSFRLSPSAVLIFTDTSSGGASSAISRSVVFRE